MKKKTTLKSSSKKSIKKTVSKKSASPKKPNPEQFNAFKRLKSMGHNLILNTGFNSRLDYVAELNNPFSQSHPAVRIGRSTTGVALFIPQGMTGETLTSVKEKFNGKTKSKTTTDGIRKVSRTIFETIEAKKQRKTRSGKPRVSSGKSTRVAGVNKKSLVLECFNKKMTPQQTLEHLASINVQSTLPSIRWWFNDFKNQSQKTDIEKAIDSIGTVTLTSGDKIVVNKKPEVKKPEPLNPDKPTDLKKVKKIVKKEYETRVKRSGKKVIKIEKKLTNSK